MSSSLIAFDTNKIKSYVFGTGTLKEIRGASALLDRLNQEDMVELAGGIKNKIYANGGGGLFKVDGGDAEAKLVIEEVKRVYGQKTRSGASITGVSVPLPAQTDNIEQQLKLIRYRLRLAKDQSNTKVYPVTHSLLRFCDSCGTRYAQTSLQDDMLCESCCHKREEDGKVKNDIDKWAYAPEEANPSRLWGKLLQNLRQQNIHLLGRNRPEDFDQIGEQSRPKGYMGLIYADGDGMGKIIEGITSGPEMTNFADAVNNSIYQATGEAIGKYLEPESGSTWPFDVLLLGGDDLVMVTRAQSAIEVALHVVERFPQLTECQKKWGKPLSLSASVVITHVKYPIGSLVKLAESGLKFAKRQAAKRRLVGEEVKGGLLNFLVVNSANQLDFSQHYKQTLKQEDRDGMLYRTQRPYTVQEMHNLLTQIRHLREVGVPRSKLEQLRAALFKSRRQGTLDAMMATLRLSKRPHINALLELVGHQTQQKLHLPWIEKERKGQEGKDWVTPILDITELFDFVR